MSQFWQGVTAGSLPPTVPTTFTTDTGTSVPAANNLNIKGGDTTDNVVFGIETTTGPADQVNILLTNRYHGSVTTSDGLGQTRTVATCPMPLSPAVYTFKGTVNGINSIDGLAGAVNFTISYRTTGGVPVLLTNPSYIYQDDIPFVGLAVFNASLGLLTISVTGEAGKTINWVCVGEYVVAS